MKFDLIIPLYNPIDNWEKKLLSKFNSIVDSYFDRDKTSINLILVNDGSPKNFTDYHIGFLKAAIPNIDFVSYELNKGKGYALRQGVSKAKTGFCIYSDYDFPFGLNVISNVYNHLANGVDIVTGRRITGNYFSSLPIKRQLISKGLVFFNKYVLRLPVYDTQAGIKGFNKYGMSVFSETSINRFLFDMEFILLASRVDGMVIKEVDVSITEDTTLSDFGFSVLKQEMLNLFKILARRKYEPRSKTDIVQH
ncbi:hypothetical protein CAP35_10815 [Chitinophagaceae bacterium IBVUCB1]|nr:hypothetical protein CAP35_10815 [Chitinophagaceae bacterium IBVUCB1]